MRMYSDFEVLQPSCASRNDLINTEQNAMRQVCSYNIYVEAHEELNIGLRTFPYTGKEAAIVWADLILEAEKIIKSAIKSCNALLIKRPEYISAFEAATECLLCNQSFDESPITVSAEKTERLSL